MSKERVSNAADAAYFVPSEALLRTGFFTVDSVRTMHAVDYPWAHEVRVAVPRTYGTSDRAYPVLWILDNLLESALAVLGDLDLILVGVGNDRESGWYYAAHRRVYDFYPVKDFHPDGARGDALRLRNEKLYSPRLEGGGADAFLAFLLDDVRTALASEYRMDRNDQALFGFSAAGWFVLYTMLTRPSAFTKYIAGSPALYFCHNLIFDIEAAFAAKHTDLRTDLFLGAGEGEIVTDSAFGILSSMVKMAELLALREYPSLRMTVKIFPGETHATATPVAIGSGVRSVWPSLGQAPAGN
jgi:predicted alpha/beta superfamily hydrolase